MKRKKLPTFNSAKIAILFFAFVFLVILASLIFKGVALVNKSQYDSSKRFTIMVSNDKDLEVISFAPKSKSISRLKIAGATKSINVNKFLEIPIDAEVRSRLNIKDSKVADLMAKFILNLRNLKTNLTIVDFLKLYLNSKSIPINYVYDKTISTFIDPQTSDKIVLSLFGDENIAKENLSIKIVNATDVTGLGNKLGRLISNMSGNVVIVSTADSAQKESSISYFGKKSYTVEKLSKILGFPILKLDSKAIADVVIAVGKESVEHLNF